MDVLNKSFDTRHRKGGLWTVERQLVGSVRGEPVNALLSKAEGHERNQLIQNLLKRGLRIKENSSLGMAGTFGRRFDYLELAIALSQGSVAPLRSKLRRAFCLLVNSHIS